LAINPGGTVPAIDDDGFRLSESIAINFYLADKYAPELMGNDARERARVFEWSLWAIANLQPDALTLMFAAMGRDPDTEVAESAARRIQAMLSRLDATIGANPYLLGDRFTAADVNAGSVVNIAHAIGRLDRSVPNAKAWMERLKERPAFKRAAGRPSTPEAT
jgi:glutathione S-transferase